MKKVTSFEEPQRELPSLSLRSFPAGMSTVDHSAQCESSLLELTAETCQRFGHRILFTSPAQDLPAGDGIVLKEPVRVIACAYHDEPDSVDSILAPFNIRGWAQVTVGKLFEAAGCGNLCASPRAAYVDQVPALALRLLDSRWKAAELFDVRKHQNKVMIDPLDIQKVAVMDYLVDYRDRHGFDVFVCPEGDNGEGYSPIVGVAGWSSFQYQPPRLDLWDSAGYVVEHVPKNYLSEKTMGLWILWQHSYDNGWYDLAVWWQSVRDAVRLQFLKECQAIKDSGIASHVRESFMRRFALISAWSDKPISDPFVDFPAIRNTEASKLSETVLASQRIAGNEQPLQRARALLLSCVESKYSPEQLKIIAEAILVCVQKMSQEELVDFYLLHSDDRKINVPAIFSQRKFDNGEELARLINSFVNSLSMLPNKGTLFPLIDGASKVEAGDLP
jgi:hypothetical protein